MLERGVSPLPELAALRAADGGGGGRLLDIGSGAGKVVFTAVLTGGYDSAVGIECNGNREQCTWLAARFAVPRVSFFRGDAGDWLPPGATHLYSFNKTFPPADLRRIAAQLNRYASWRVMVSSLDARAWVAHGLRGVEDAAPLYGLGMVGSGCRYAMYVIRRRGGGGGGGGSGGGVSIVADEGEEASAVAPLPPPRVRRRRSSENDCR